MPEPFVLLQSDRAQLRGVARAGAGARVRGGGRRHDVCAHRFAHRPAVHAVRSGVLLPPVGTQRDTAHVSDEVTRVRTWRDAETLAVSVLRAWGHPDATVTNAGADGGIDVRGRHVLAQVKHRSAPTGRPDIQRLFGARGTGTEDLFFFSGSGYSPQAIDYGEVHDIGLFSYTADGTMTAHTRTADALMPRVETAVVKLAPGRATGGQTPDSEGVGRFLFGIVAGVVFGILAWFNGSNGDAGDLVGLILFCGFLGAMFGAGGLGGGKGRK